MGRSSAERLLFGRLPDTLAMNRGIGGGDLTSPSTRISAADLGNVAGPPNVI